MIYDVATSIFILRPLAIVLADDGDSVASDTSGGLRPSFDGNGVTPARKSSLLANRTRYR